MPGPEAFLAFCAAQTERVHLGSAIFNITPPVNKPVRVAENVALLDHLTDNRFEFGTGRGSSTTEVHGFDIADIDETKAMWREAIREIPKMWKDDVYCYEGTYFRVPERKVFPKPHGPATPPCGSRPAAPARSPRRARWASAPSASRWASPPQMAPLLDNYKDAIGDATPVGDYVNDNIMGVTNMLCMEDRNKAFETAVQHGHELLHEPRLPLARQRPEPKGFPEWPDHDPRARRPSRSSSSPRATSPSRRPRRLRAPFAAVGRHRLRPADLQPDHQHAARPTWSSRRWSCSAARSSPASTRTRSTRPPATARPAAVVRSADVRAGVRRRALTRSDDADRSRPTSRPQSFNFADLWEAVWPRVADRVGARVRRAAPHLRRAGRPGQPARPPPAGGRASSPATTSGCACRNGVE